MEEEPAVLMGGLNASGSVMEEASVREASKLNGKNLIDSSSRRDFGVIVVAPGNRKI